MSKCFWSYNYRHSATWKLTTYCCIASRPTVTACCHPSQTNSRFFLHLMQLIFAVIQAVSKPLITEISVPQEQRWQVDRRLFLAMDAALWTCHCPESQDQYRDRDSRVPRPIPRPKLWDSKTKTKTPRFKTKTETKTCKNGFRDVSRPRLSLETPSLLTCKLRTNVVRVNSTV